MGEKLILKSIEEEAADCRKAFEGVEVGAWVSHCHHGRDPFEKLTEPAENRIVYIREYKPIEEQALRFRCFRPMSKEDGDSLGSKLATLDADYQAKGDALWADYNAKRDALWADYLAKCDALWADYNAKRDALWADYQAKGDALWADYRAKRAPLCADYRAKLATAYAGYKAKISALHREYCTDDCPWDGETLFPERKD